MRKYARHLGEKSCALEDIEGIRREGCSPERVCEQARGEGEEREQEREGEGGM